ncbi:MAG TPA: PAS domain S-box protein, partial [Thermodesulfobacteriota bacterium]|nr:PAS domain S-box protein [Thermodesulfobacteriota bacterium]
IRPDDLIRCSDKFGDAVRNPGTNVVAELRFRHHDGHWCILETVGKTLSDDSGALRSIVIARDITERKKADERMREQATLLDKAQDAIIVRDLESRIIYWNKSAERLYGWTADQVLCKSANEILHNDYSLHLMEAEKCVLDKGEWMGELQQITEGDKEIIVESRWTLVRDEDEEPKSILTINTDITEKKRLEAQLLRAQRMDSIGILAGGIAHDLNNILTPVMIGLGLLRGRLVDTHSQNILDTLELSIQRGADLVKQVLSFTRGLEGERNELQVKYLISEISKIVEQTFPKSIKVRTSIPKDLWFIKGDLTQLHQVLINLCVNARDAMPHGGILDISAENLLIDENYVKMDIDAEVGLYVVLTISDTGTGIPPKIMDRIFEPFFSTKEPGKGTGLGLSTSFGIVKSHGGFIQVQSELGNGTQFRIYLPAVKSNKEPKSEERNFKVLSKYDGELILVVDDEAFIREMVRDTLEAEGYRVITANNGREAIELYKRHEKEIKVIIMDLMMPVMDGPSSIRKLKTIDPNVKIIVTSGLIERDKLAEISSVDIQAILLKPYTPETLLKNLHGVLSANHKNSNEIARN